MASFNNVALSFATSTVKRLEIDEFVQNSKLANLYLLALEDLMSDKQTLGKDPNWKSWFWISKIHGWPYGEWNGVVSQPNAAAQEGYCSHGSALFPTWHRVYLALLEESLGAKITDIAKSFTKDQKAYVEAAGKFRLPYWDPTLPRQEPSTGVEYYGLPTIANVATVYVRRPAKPDDLVPASNPLYSFKFTPKMQATTEVNGFNQQALAHFYQEIRNRSIPGKDASYPTMRHKYQANTYPMSNQIKQLTSGLFAVLTSRDWQQFSNHRTAEQDLSNMLLSLESWHDNIHGIVGGFMGYPRFAAFDPIFWLHHCNIDRLLAYYQARPQPVQMTSTTISDEANFVVADKEAVDENTPLRPFRVSSSDSNLFWKSSEAKIMDATSSGFDVSKEAIKNAEAIWRWVAQGSSGRLSRPKDLKYPLSFSAVEALTGRSSQSEVSSRVAQQPMKLSASNPHKPGMANSQALHSEGQDAEVTSSDATNPGSTAQWGPPGATSHANSMRTWSVQFQVPKFAFNGSFDLHIFFGKPNDSLPESFLSASNSVGFSSIFASTDDARCGNCDQQRQRDVLYGDSIPLTPELALYLETNISEDSDSPPMDQRVLKSLEPDEVVPFLKRSLRWRITVTTGNGVSTTLKTAEEVGACGLVLLVSDRIYHFPTDTDLFGTYDVPTPHPDITRGRIGGVPQDSQEFDD